MSCPDSIREEAERREAHSEVPQLWISSSTQHLNREPIERTEIAGITMGDNSIMNTTAEKSNSPSAEEKSITIAQYSSSKVQVDPRKVKFPTVTSRLVRPGRVNELASIFMDRGFSTTGTMITVCKMEDNEGDEFYCIDGSHRIAALQLCLEKYSGKNRDSLELVWVQQLIAPNGRLIFDALEVLKLSLEANIQTHDVASVSIADNVCAVIEFLRFSNQMDLPVVRLIPILKEVSYILPSDRNRSENSYRQYINIAKGFNRTDSVAFVYWSSIPSVYNALDRNREIEDARTEGRDPDFSRIDSADMYGCVLDLVNNAIFRNGTDGRGTRDKEWFQWFVLEMTASWTRMRRKRGLVRNIGSGSPFTMRTWLLALLAIYDMAEVVRKWLNSATMEEFVRTDLAAENAKEVGDNDHRIGERIVFVLVDFHDDVVDSSSLRTKNGMFTNSFYDKLEYATGTKAMQETKAEEERERNRMTPGEIEKALVDGAKAEDEEAPTAAEQGNNSTEKETVETSGPVQAEEGVSAEAQAEQEVSAVVEEEQEITPNVVAEEVIPAVATKAIEEAPLSTPKEAEDRPAAAKEGGQERPATRLAAAEKREAERLAVLQKEQERLSASRAERESRARDNSPGRIVREDLPQGRKQSGDTQSLDINLDNSGRMDIDTPGQQAGDAQNRSVILKLRIRTPETYSTSPAEVDKENSGRSRSSGGSGDENESRLDKKRRREDTSAKFSEPNTPDDNIEIGPPREKKSRVNARKRTTGEEAPLFTDEQENSLPDRTFAEDIPEKLPLCVPSNSRMKYYITEEDIDTIRTEIMEAAAGYSTLVCPLGSCESQQYFSYQRRMIDELGYVVLQDIFSSTTVGAATHELFTQMASTFQGTTSGSSASQKNPWKPLRPKDSTGVFKTDRKSICDDLEQESARQYRNKLILELGKAICAENLKLGFGREEAVVFPETGLRLILTAEGSQEQLMHTDVPVREGTGTGPLNSPSYFMMAAGADGFIIRIAKFSHVCLSHPAKDKYRVPVTNVRIPPYSLLVCRTDVYHGGMGFAEGRSSVRYQHPIRSHLSLRTSREKLLQPPFNVNYWERLDI